MSLPFGLGADRVFTDRTEAGRELAVRLAKYRDQDPVVLAIPRGGVIVAVEVADALHAPLDVVIPRKIGAPGNPELAIGAIAGPAEVVLNESVIAELGVDRSYIEREVQRQLAEIDRRTKLYLGERGQIPIEGRTAVVVDDGLATGFTALAAVRHVRSHKPRRLALAVPVAPRETCGRLSREVDDMLCLETPEMFFAVGQFYRDFAQVGDGEVVEILSRYSERYEGPS
ncbi:MAG: phosphoribosyltransferase [Candidatus Aquicultorales bacterium]